MTNPPLPGATTLEPNPLLTEKQKAAALQAEVDRFLSGLGKHDWDNPHAVHEGLGRKLTGKERKVGKRAEFRKNWRFFPSKMAAKKIKGASFEALEAALDSYAVVPSAAERKNLRNRRRRGKFGPYVAPTVESK